MLKIDDRMTEETKEFAMVNGPAFETFFLNDINKSREFIEKADDEEIRHASFDGLIIEECFINSSKDNYPIPVTFYIPQAKTPTSKIIIYYHGGGFMLLTRKTYHRQIAYFAKMTNTIWVQIEYRQTPEYKYPVQINDCHSVTDYVINNKENIFASDKSTEIGICGDSAGGNLAAALCHLFREKIAFQILIYPWLDLTSNSDTYREFTSPYYFITPRLLEFAISAYVNHNNEASSPQISPLFNNDFTNIPKTCVIIAELDPLADDGRRYVEKLKKANIQAELHVVKGSVHGFVHNYLKYKQAFFEGAEHVIGFIKRV